jgi:hypothetical protein
MPSPAPSPKFGSSSALYVIEIAAELSSNGMKYSTARNPRYRLCAARNTPIRIDSGVCTAHDSTMTRNVTHRACGRPGSLSVAFQLVRPDGWISPIPSQVVKLNASTPTSGITPNPMNIASAGNAIQATGPLPPPAAPTDVFTGTTGGASVVICR